MGNTVISVENLSKTYRLGQIGTGTLTNDLKVWWARARGKPNPLLKIGQEDQGNRDGEILWALKDVSFQVEQGEVLGIIGRNGAGKSTLLKILSRVTAPTSGQIKVKGRIASLLEVGTGFHPELTGRENIYLNGAILGMSRKEIDRKFDEIVDFAEVEQFIDTPVKRYSSGMYVRLAFAVAAHLESEILLVDEVLAVGDAEFQKKCLGKMGDVANKEGRTVLFVSHNMGAVSHLCTNAVLIDRGKIRLFGGTDDVIATYLEEERRTKYYVEFSSVWDAPGDKTVRLIRAGIMQDDEYKGIININRPIKIQMSFQIFGTAKNLITGVSFYKQTVCLFNCCDWRKNCLHEGEYEKSVVVPAYTLAEGDIDVLIQLVFFDPSVRSVVLPNLLNFECVDSNDPFSVRGLYKGHWPGLLRLRLNWSDAVRKTQP